MNEAKTDSTARISIEELKTALKNGDFETWYQPQFNISTGEMSGAEALVRLKKGDSYLSPGFFMPLLEESGLVFDLDRRIWEQVCCFLHELLVENLPAVPVSVNIAAEELLREDFLPVFTEIKDRYEIPGNLFCLELSESSLAATYKEIGNTVQKLVERSVPIIVDGFGFGHNSLDALRVVPATSLKLNLNDFSVIGQEERSGLIIESIVRLANWLNMTVVAEKVEDERQMIYLRSIGCSYVQGFFCAKPMPMKYFLAMVKKKETNQQVPVSKSEKKLLSNEFWNPKSMETLIFNSYVGGTCIFEYFHGETELLRMNDQFQKELGTFGTDSEKNENKHEIFWLNTENSSKMYQNIQKAIETGKSQTVELMLSDKERKEYIRSTVKVIAFSGERYLLFCIIINITEQRVAEQKQREAEKKLSDERYLQLKEEAALQYARELSIREELLHETSLYFTMNLTELKLEEYRDKYNIFPGIKGMDLKDETLDRTILTFVSSKDQKRIRNTFYPDSLISAYARHQNHVTLEYQREMNNGSIHWMKVAASILRRPPHNELIAFLFITDIDREKKDRLALNKVINRNTGSVSILNRKTGLHHIINSEDKLKWGVCTEDFDHDTELKRIVETHVFTEDKSKCLQKLCLEHLCHSLETEEINVLSFRVVGADGQLLWRRTEAFYLDETKEEIVIADQDITTLFLEEQVQKQKLQEAVDKANKANAAKSEFLSRMSHDMRTPLNGVLGLVTLALKEKDEEKKRRYLETIQVSGEFLLSLINDVLDIGKIESGKLEMKQELFCLIDLKEYVETVIGPLMKEKNIRCIVELKDMDTYIFVDRLRLMQVFFNLLSNSVKFTEAGGTVELLETKLPPKDGLVGMRFIVRDTGVGMSKEFMERMFLPFEQEQNGRTNRYKGSGLGLAIVKKLVEAMNGTITVRSELDIGTEFTIDLYAKIGKKDSSEDKMKPEIVLTGMKVLLVEDNEINNMVAENILKMKGCVVTTKENGQEGLQSFLSSDPGAFDVILMDIRMPVMDGMEATRRIRSSGHKDAAFIPIIAMTADAFCDDAKELTENGMNGKILKPIETGKLFQMLSGFYKRKE